MLVKYFSTGIAAALKTPSIQAALLLLIIPMTIDAISLIKGISAPIQKRLYLGLGGEREGGRKWVEESDDKD
ncbi:hypothetical protein LguiA_005937 [Lonicera macranthoides]